MPEKRTRRTPEQLAKDYEEKIQKIRKQADEQIATLERKKEDILNPKKRMTKAQKLEAVFQSAKRSKMSAEDAAEKLGINFDEALASYKEPRKPATKTTEEPAEDDDEQDDEESEE